MLNRKIKFFKATYKIFLLCTYIVIINGCASSPKLADAQTNLVEADGSYPTIPLAKDVITLKVVQNGVKNLQDATTVAAGLENNLNKMLRFIDQACNEGQQPDIILFNEFPLTGYSTGTREEKLEFTLTIPGPETDRLGLAARECDSYIVFGSYAQDKDWPGHILSLNTVINRQGEVVERFWKTRNVKRLGDGEIPTTTIENVRTRYRAMYGVEAEFPIVKTEFGNIAVSTVQLDAFVFAAFAMRGTEIMLRTSTLFSQEDVQAMARFNNFYSAMSNITFPPDGPYAKYGGGSLIVGPDAKILAIEPSNDEKIISAQIPIKAFREGRTIPHYPLEVVAPVFDQYQQEIPLDHLDMPAEQLPKTREDMKALLDQKSRYLNKDQ